MRSALLAASGKANAESGKSAGSIRQVCRSILPDMRKLKGKRPHKLARALADITGAHYRTAERWVAGEVTPDGESTLKIYLSEFGPAFLEAKVAELSPKEQERFWREMGKAWKRADLRRRQDALDRERDDLNEGSP